MRKFSIACVLVLAAHASAATPKPALPPNTIDCKDFTRLPNGYWAAHHDAKPFDLGTATHTVIRDSVFGPHLLKQGGYDLSDVLDRKCGR